MIRETIAQHLWLALMSAVTTFIPRMLPLTYSAIGGLQINGADLLILSTLSVGGAVIGTTILWMLDYYAAHRIKKYIKIPKKWTKNEQLPNENSFKKSQIARWTDKLHNKLHVINNTRVLFWLVALTTYTAIPDILIIRYTRKKLPLPLFLIATGIGKVFVYIPIIYGIDVLTKIL